MKLIQKVILLIICCGFVSEDASAVVCPVVVSSNSSTPIADAGFSCAVTVNSGITLTVSGSSNAVTISGLGSNLTNNGTITMTGTGFGVASQGGSISTITNTGTISALSGNGIRSSQVLTTINNSGSISSTGSHAIYSYWGSVTNLINTGSLTGGVGSSGIKLGGSSNSTITNFTNAGTMLGGSSGYGVYANPVSGTIGTISKFNNIQGGNGTSAATTALTYYGKLPAYYNIIVRSPTQYGQLSVSTPSSTMTFGIYAGGSGVTDVAASTLTAGTYRSVLTGISLSNLAGSRTGTYGAYNWSLDNASGTTWDLVVTGGPSTNSSGTTSAAASVTSGTVVGLSSIGVTVNPVLAGGTIALTKGDRSSQSLVILSEGGFISAPTSGAAQLSGTLSGPGKVTFNGTGMTIISGANTYTGGTVVESGTLSLLGGTLGSGDVYVAPGANLIGTGSIAGAVTVAGLFKPGNSPGYISATSNVSMTNGSVYQQDIAGTMQSVSSSPVGANGYYSYLNITGGQFIINSGSTLSPALSNLFNEAESGYGSAPYTPVLGDRFRIVTADGGISGKFSTVTQPAELTSDTQFLPFYNMDGTNSLDLAVIPKSYATTIATNSGNKNARSIGSALEKMVIATHAGVSTNTQDQLLYAGSTQNAGSLASYAQSLAGEVYSAAVAVIAQTTQRVQQAILTRLGDTLGLSMPNAMSALTGNSALMASSNMALSGGLVPASVSSNRLVDPNTEYQSLTKGNIWGDLVYQKGNRSSDSYSGGWNSNLYQMVFGSDFYVTSGMRVGGGFALSSTTLNPTYGSGTLQQGSVFAYGKIPVDDYVVDAMATFGLNSSDLSRGDITGLSRGFRNKTVPGNDALVSLGLSRPIDLSDFRITPFARVTWQMVSQRGVKEGDAASALSVSPYTGNGVRGMLGVAVGSKANDSMTEKYTYRAYIAVGADTAGILNPTLNASIAGIGTNISTPYAGSAFMQAGLYGTVKVSDNAYAFAGLSAEARSGQALGAVNVGVRIQF